jgi:hypothetical protein
MILEDNYVTDTSPSSCPVMLPTTRSRRNIVGGKDTRAQPSGDSEGNSGIHTPAADTVVGEPQEGPTSSSQVVPSESEESDGKGNQGNLFLR